MQEFLAFLLDELILSGTFVILTLMLAWSFMAPSLRGFKELKPVEIINKINNENAVVIDVRSENEFLQGHIINSINMPSNYLAKRMNELDKYKTSPVVVVCKSGARSKAACAALRKAGYEDVTGLAGGVMAWQHEKYPLKK